MITEDEGFPFIDVKEWRGEESSLSVCVNPQGVLSHVVLHAYGRGGSSFAYLPATLTVADGPEVLGEHVLWSASDKRFRLAHKQFCARGQAGDVSTYLWLFDIWDQLKTEFIPALAEAIALAAKLREEAAP